MQLAQTRARYRRRSGNTIEHKVAPELMALYDTVLALKDMRLEKT